jgi:hypothetical protein
MLTLLLLAVLCSYAAAEIKLSDDMNESFQLMRLSTYKGQFGCLHPDLNGQRNMLIFSFILNNTGDSEVRRYEPYELYYAVLDGAILETSGSIEIDALRDTSCYWDGSMKFYNADVHTPAAGLSSHCLFIIRAGADCLWIDVTSLAQKPYTVVLSLLPIANPLVPPAGALVSSPNLLTIPRRKLGGLRDAVLITLFAVLAVFYVGLYPCVRYLMGKPSKAKYTKDKQT